MIEEIQSVRDRVNDDFARIIGESGVDYRVILVSRFDDGAPGRAIDGCARIYPAR